MLSLLLLAAAQSATGRVQALSPSDARPLAPQPTPTLVVEPAAMAIAACDADGAGRTSRAELDVCLARSFAAIDTAHAGKLRPIAYADWATRYLGNANALPSLIEADADATTRCRCPSCRRRSGASSTGSTRIATASSPAPSC